MAALPGAQPAQLSAGPKRAAWQRALFRFPIPNRRLRGYCVTPYYRVHRSASAVGLFKLRTFAKKWVHEVVFLVCARESRAGTGVRP